MSVLGALVGLSAGCTAFLNSWLDPTQVGSFFREGTLEIRSTLTIQDSPSGIPGATDPTPEDLIPIAEPYEFGPSDQINVRILDLMVDNTETNVQVTLDEEGQVSLPILGRLTLAGLTAREMEAELADILRQRGLINDAEVVVQPVVKRDQTFTIFGAIQNPSLYPILRPDFRMLDAINIAGGLAETVTEAYVIRRPHPPPEQPYAQRGRTGSRPRVGSVAAAPAGGFAISDGVTGSSPPGAPRDGPPRDVATDPGSGPAPAAPEPADSQPADSQPTDSQPADIAQPPHEMPRNAPNGSLLESVLNQREAERDLIEAVVGSSAKPLPSTMPAAPGPSTAPAAVRPSTEPAVTRPSTEPSATEPVAEETTPTLPRFIFLNGKWIETRTPATRPQAERQPEATRPGVQPPGAPAEFPRPPTETPETQPVIDWSQIAGDVEQRVIRISADGLRDGDPRQNIVVRPGDTIRLIAGEVGEYYIMGQINRPGAYSLTGRRLTLKMAIAAAGNIAPLGWPDRCTVYRRYGDREEMIQVNPDAIFAGKEADFFVKRDDLILVGTHPAAPFLAVIRNAFRMTYGFGFVYDRNFADIDSYGSQPNPAFQQERFPNLFQ